MQDLQGILVVSLEQAVAAPLATARLADAGARVIKVERPEGDFARGYVSALEQDIAALDHAGVSALMAPKVESPAQLAEASRLSDGIPLIALIETPLGVLNLREIGATSGLCGLMLGSEDLSAALGIDLDQGGLKMPAAQLAMVAAAFQLLPIGFPGSIANFRDLDLYAAQIGEARGLGFHAVAAIHPTQLPVIRQALSPTPSEIDWAGKVVEQAAAAGAVSAIDGMMIDAPVIARARRILARIQS